MSTVWSKAVTLSTYIKPLFPPRYVNFRLVSSCVKPAFSTKAYSYSPIVKVFIGASALGTVGSVKVGLHGLTKVYCDALKPKKTTRVLSSKKYRREVKEDLPFPWQAFWQLLMPDMWLLLAAVLSAIIVAVTNIQIPLLLGDLVNVVSKFTHKQQISYVSEVQQPVLQLLAYYAGQSVMTFAYISLLSAVGERMAARLREQLFTSLIKQDIAFFDANRTGELVSRLTSDVQDFKSSFKLCISQGLRSVTQIVGCAVSLYLISPGMSGVMLISVPSVIVTGTAIGSLLRKLSRKAQAQVARSASVAEEALSNIRTVRAFAMENQEIELYKSEIEHGRLLSQELGLGIGAFQGMSNLVLNGVVMSVICVGGYYISCGQLNPGQLMSFLVATQTLQRSLAQVSLLFGQVVRGSTAAARVFEYVHVPSNLRISGGLTIPYHSLLGDVHFNNISFTYPTRPGHLVLSDFNLHVPAGQIVALCGPSGAGKSTVAALLEGFYQLDGGSIVIDGEDMSRLDPSWLRGRAIGYINQEPTLFATSVKENIRYGRTNATDDEVYEAARLANAHGFISDFPHGYDTLLGERGVTVSGGQKQRIAIARALLKDPAILILDEATSALDVESERLVQEALDRVTRGRTTLVIAHRLSTIQNAHLIAVVEKGRVAELGNHKQLTRKRGLYWQLIKQQEFSDQHIGA